MKLPISIDCCAWNYLFDHEVDLANSLPAERFALTMTREVEIEISSIPDAGKDGSDKRPLKEYIANSIALNNSQTSFVFGFASVEPDGSLSPVQVFGGFDQGTFQSDSDREWYGSSDVQKQLNGKKVRPSGLLGNQADAAVAVRSFDCVVLTNERKSKGGPIKLAAEQNGNIAYLEDFESSGLLLAEFIEWCKKSNDERE